MSTSSNSSVNRKRTRAEAFGITPPRGRVWLPERPEMVSREVVAKARSGGWLVEDPEEQWKRLHNFDNPLYPPESPRREVISISSDNPSEDSDETLGSQNTPEDDPEEAQSENAEEWGLLHSELIGLRYQTDVWQKEKELTDLKRDEEVKELKETCAELKAKYEESKKENQVLKKENEDITLKLREDNDNLHGELLIMDQERRSLAAEIKELRDRHDQLIFHLHTKIRGFGYTPYP